MEQLEVCRLFAISGQQSSRAGSFALAHSDVDTGIVDAFTVSTSVVQL
jgi:hypothetical protein